MRWTENERGRKKKGRGEEEGKRARKGERVRVGGSVGKEEGEGRQPTRNKPVKMEMKFTRKRERDVIDIPHTSSYKCK